MSEAQKRQKLLSQTLARLTALKEVLESNAKPGYVEKEAVVDEYHRALNTLAGTTDLFTLTMPFRIQDEDFTTFGSTRTVNRVALMTRLKSVITVLTEQSSPKTSKAAPRGKSKRVFIVHGHDDKAKNELELLLRDFGLEPIVLHRQPDRGRTLIEKFEKYSDVGFAFILLTPDDMAYPASEDSLDDSERQKEYRARQNVMFEFGFLVGKLERENVCCLRTGDVAIPSDLSGLLYKKYSESIEEVAHAIRKELTACGYELNP